MSFWAIFSLILLFAGACSTGILAFIKFSGRKKKTKYVFYSDEGEEIPLGI